MQIGDVGRVLDRAVSIFASSSASSTSGMPALTSSTSAPASTCAFVSATTVERSPPRSSSANFLRPVGLMRSPMMQNGCSAPMTTVLDRASRTVSIVLLAGYAGTAARRCSSSSLAFLTADEASAE